MPLFDFLRRPAPKAEPAPPPVEPGTAFDCCTEDWRIRGRVAATGRLLDSMNRREALEIGAAEWAPLDGTAAFQAAPGLKSVDPYDVLLVFAAASTMPSRSPESSAAHRRSKETYDVILEVPPFHVVGTVHLYPGLQPATLLDHSTNLFVAVTGAVVLLGDVRVGPDEPATILVNRSYITRVHEVEDARRHQAGIVAAAMEPEPEPEPEPGVAAEPEPAAEAADASEVAAPPEVSAGPAAAPEPGAAGEVAAPPEPSAEPGSAGEAAGTTDPGAA